MDRVPVKAREQDLSTKTLLPWVTAWWGVGVTRPTSAREAKQFVGGLKPVNFNFESAGRESLCYQTVRMRHREVT